MKTRFLGVLFVLCLLLTVGMPASAQSPDPEYFEETGHYVGGEFLAYYRGAPNATTIFGYPITEAFVKNGLTIQYFQRARFELHAGQPVGQRVRLTPIGRELYKPGEQLDIFNPFACRYFPVAGHSVCYAFRDFYEQNGGEARFGLPISPFEYRNDLIVQYFEYARFEWRYSETTGQRVVLADAGREYFDFQREDPNLLTARPIEEGSGKLLRMQTQAFVWKAVTLASDQQLVYIIAQDQSLLPVVNAQGTAVIRWPDGTTTAQAFVTNSAGVGIVPLIFTGQPYGKTVIIEISVVKDGLTTATTTSFRIWY